MKKKVAVILTGCGHLDGTEIREAVLTLWALDEEGAEVAMFAPDKEHHAIINHRSGELATDHRNILTESARIARGDISPLALLNPERFDAVVIPGGFGVLKHLTHADGLTGTLQADTDIATLLLDFFRAKKPIGALCIAPALVVASLASEASIEVTIGDDPEGMVAHLGGRHRVARCDEAVCDHVHRIATCSAFMRDDPLSGIARGIHAVIAQLMAWTRSDHG